MSTLGVIELGHGQTLQPAFDRTGPDATLLGWVRNHPDARKPFLLCSSFAGIVPREGRDIWRVIQAEPLTLEPSLRCRACGSHGFVRDGKWVPA
jgi:hypothetical protein